MKFIVFAVVVFGAVVVSSLPTPDVSHLLQPPQPPQPHTPILEHKEVRDEAGQYALSYLTANGIAFAEQGALKPNQAGTANVLVKQGSYSYYGPDGRTYTVRYVADENGFQPIGDHFPQSPEVPEVTSN